jgi:cell wall assembly regulator SMI1
MHLADFPARFQKLTCRLRLNYSLADPASDDDILRAEQRLGVLFPTQIKLFYRRFNGLCVDEPQLEVFPVERLEFASPKRLHFATVDNVHRLFFDVSHNNAAGQWNILTDADYLVTLTMASFWSNKIWAWVERRREIWHD